MTCQSLVWADLQRSVSDINLKNLSSLPLTSCQVFSLTTKRCPQTQSTGRGEKIGLER